MLCRDCSHTNPDENKFCGNCGAKLLATGRVTLKDLLDAKLLKAGDALTIKLRGKDVTATLLADGKLRYQNQNFDGPMACAEAIRGQVCDSWFCWKATDHATGESHGISHWRSALQKAKGH